LTNFRNSGWQTTSTIFCKREAELWNTIQTLADRQVNDRLQIAINEKGSKFKFVERQLEYILILWNHVIKIAESKGGHEFDAVSFQAFKILPSRVVIGIKTAGSEKDEKDEKKGYGVGAGRLTLVLRQVICQFLPPAIIILLSACREHS